MNPIEGLWGSMKRFVRANGDQTYSTMMQLIPLAKDAFAERNIHLKLIRRFWKTVEEYQRGTSYGDVLKLYFANLCKPDVTSHRRIFNNKLT